MSGGKSILVSYLNKRDPLLLLTIPMATSSMFVIPLGHLLPKPHPKPPMSPLTPPYLAMVIGNRDLDFNMCVCVCERERERDREVEKLILLEIDLDSYMYVCVCVCVCERERERERGIKVGL